MSMLRMRRTAAGIGAGAIALTLTLALGAPPAGAQTPVPPSIATVAGSGRLGFAGDGGPATNAKLEFPTGVAEDAVGNLYFADTLNFRIRKVTSAGVISTVAGSGGVGFTGDGGPATAAKLWLPSNPALDSTGSLYFADSGNQRIRRVSIAGIINTVAGTGQCGQKGNGGQATAAQLCDPTAVAIDATGNLYIADTGNNEIRKVTPAGIISIYAGTGRFGFAGDNGPATNARLGEPDGVAVDSLHNLYIADSANNRVRQVDSAGVIRTFAGSAGNGFHGDGGPASSATLNHPEGVGVDPLGTIYIADSFNFRIRAVAPSGVISTYAGSGIPGYSGDGGVATKARLNVVQGDLAVGGNSLFFTDTLNERVRAVTAGPPPNIAESKYTILLPLSALALLAIGGVIIVRRHRRPIGGPTA